MMAMDFAVLCQPQHSPKPFCLCPCADAAGAFVPWVCFICWSLSLAVHVCALEFLTHPLLSQGGHCPTQSYIGGAYNVRQAQLRWLVAVEPNREGCSTLLTYPALFLWRLWTGCEALQCIHSYLRWQLTMNSKDTARTLRTSPEVALCMPRWNELLVRWPRLFAGFKARSNEDVWTRIGICTTYIPSMVWTRRMNVHTI